MARRDQSFGDDPQRSGRNDPERAARGQLRALMNAAQPEYLSTLVVSFPYRRAAFPCWLRRFRGAGSACPVRRGRTPVAGWSSKTRYFQRPRFQLSGAQGRAGCRQGAPAGRGPPGHRATAARCPAPGVAAWPVIARKLHRLVIRRFSDAGRGDDRCCTCSVSPWRAPPGQPVRLHEAQRPGRRRRLLPARRRVLDHSASQRSNNRRIQADSFIYIGQGPFVPPGYQYARPNVVAEPAFEGFVEYFPLVRRARRRSAWTTRCARRVPPTPTAVLPFLPGAITGSATGRSGKTKGTRPGRARSQCHPGHADRDQHPFPSGQRDHSQPRRFLTFYDATPEDLRVRRWSNTPRNCWA